MTRARFKILPTLIVAVAIGVAIGLVSAYATHVSAEPTPPTEYAKYQSDRWHFSLAVPADMTVSEHEREGGGHTVQFSDTTGDHQLLISAWPYSQLDLTLGRFGDPSGITDQPDHLEIVEVVRNDLFTVLFTKNAVQYSVVTLPKYEAWLIEILRTWEFTD